MRRLVPLLITLLVAAALTSCSAAPDTPGAGSTPSDRARPGDLPTPTTVATGLAAPWSIAFHGETALVSERDTARIVEVGANGRTRQIGVIPGVEGSGEGGLLGITVRGDDLYAYSTAAGGNRIQRYPLSGAVGSFSLGTPTTVLDGIPSARNHNGGRIEFGPDGMLYATTGDAGEPSSAQDIDSLAGKILRMTPDGGVPDDNPFPGSLVYSYGHRNSQGIAWAGDGTMYASEFGQNDWDEVNVIAPGSNYGWPEVEGTGGSDEYIDPVQQWPTREASPSGIAIAGDRIYIANLRGENLRVVPLNALDTSRVNFQNEFGRLRDAVVAPDGSLWVLTNNTDSRGSPRSDDDQILRIRLP